MYAHTVGGLSCMSNQWHPSANKADQVRLIEDGITELELVDEKAQGIIKGQRELGRLEEKMMKLRFVKEAEALLKRLDELAAKHPDSVVSAGAQ